MLRFLTSLAFFSQISFSACGPSDCVPTEAWVEVISLDNTTPGGIAVDFIEEVGTTPSQVRIASKSLGMQFPNGL